jgi:hypothetical protein
MSTTATFPRLTFRRVRENPCSPDISPEIRNNKKTVKNGTLTKKEKL